MRRRFDAAVETARRHQWATIGLTGAVLLLLGGAAFQAAANPAYLHDEAAHVGYVLRLQQADLPTIDSSVPLGHGAALDARLARRGAWFSEDVYVANNPPFAYVAAIPFTEVSEHTGNPGGPLAGMRLYGVVGGAAAVVTAFLLGRELGGADTFTGLVTAGLVASTLSISMVVAMASMDGIALAATTGVLWRGARFARTRTTPDATQLGIWCALAAAVRPMALALAVGVGGVAALLALRAHGRSAVPHLARIAGPALVLVSWSYLLNIRRYGDPTGSRALFAKFDMTPNTGFWDSLWDGRSSATPFAYLLRERYADGPFYLYQPSTAAKLTSAAGVAVLLAAIALAVVTARTDRRRDRAPILVPAAWALTTVAVVVPVVLLAKHYADGGGNHPRYLLPALPVFAAALALVVSRASRWLAAAAVVAATTWYLVRIRAAGHMRFPVDPFFGPLFQRPLMGQPVRATALVVAAVGGVLLAASVVALARQRAAVATPAPARSPVSAEGATA